MDTPGMQSGKGFIAFVVSDIAMGTAGKRG
jgi:hypothetical protein